MNNLASATALVVLSAAALTAACADNGPRPERLAQAPAAVALAASPASRAETGARSLSQDCKDAIKDSPAACKVTADDCKILDEIDASTDKAFDQRIDALLFSALPSTAVPMGGGPMAGHSTIRPFCNQSNCEIPVLVLPRAGTGKRCVAVLPFHRYCVLPVGGDPQKGKPQTLTFYLAEVKNGQFVKRADQDFIFVEPGANGPKPYDGDQVVGLDLHEDDGPGKRRRLQKKYFDHGTRAADGQSFSWQVTSGTVNTRGAKIGRVDGGVLSAAFVRPKGTTGVGDVCRPRDPIIVNTAN